MASLACRVLDVRGFDASAVERRRVALDLPRVQLGARAGIAPRILRGFLEGTKRPRAPSVLLLAAALDVRASELVGPMPDGVAALLDA